MPGIRLELKTVEHISHGLDPPQHAKQEPPRGPFPRKCFQKATVSQAPQTYRTDKVDDQEKIFNWARVWGVLSPDHLISLLKKNEQKK